MTPPRILFVGNFLIRHWGNGRTGIDMRLFAGALRNGWQAATFSERDIARFLAPLGFLRNVGARLMNARLVKTARNWKPDIVFLSHCDYVTNDALDAVHAAVPGVKIVHINCDSPAAAHTRGQIGRRTKSCDAIFVTSAGEGLRRWTTGRNVVGFYPNPSDISFEVEDNSRKADFVHDLFFAGRPQHADERAEVIRAILPRLDPSVRTGFFGIDGRPLVVGRAYEEAIAGSKMGLSLDRFSGWKWYSSDRITHLVGNGILTFLQRRGDHPLYADREEVFFGTPEELADKINFFQAHDAERRRIAAACRAAYVRRFDARRVLKYMVETVRGEAWSEPYEWAEEVYR